MFELKKQLLETHEALLTIRIDADAMQTAMQKAARTIAQKANIPGFRKGKAPYHVVVRNFGEQAVRQEAADALLEEIYPEALKQAALTPYAAGDLEDLQLDPLVYQIRVPLQPTVELGDYRSLRRAWVDVAVTEEEIIASLERIREQEAMLEAVERPAQLGDQLKLEELQGEAEGRVFLHEHDADLTLKEEEPFISPEFLQALVGMSKGEEKMFRLMLPADFAVADLAGTEATFNIKVQEVYQRTLPELDDALASTVGPYETLEVLKDELRERMLKMRREESASEYETAVVADLVAMAHVEYPPSALEDQLDDVVEDVRDHYQREHRMDLEDVARLQGKTMAQFREELAPRAIRQLTETLVLIEFARQEEIAISEADIDQEYRALLSTLGLDAETVAQVKLDRESRAYKELRNRAFGRKVLARLAQIARGEAAAPAEPAAA